MWLLFCLLSILFTLAALFCAAARRVLSLWASIAAIACTFATLYAFFCRICRWVLQEDWSALSDVLPALQVILMVYMILLLAANAVALCLSQRRR